MTRFEADVIVFFIGVDQKGPWAMVILYSSNEVRAKIDRVLANPEVNEHRVKEAINAFGADLRRKPPPKKLISLILEKLPEIQA